MSSLAIAPAPEVIDDLVAPAPRDPEHQSTGRRLLAAFDAFERFPALASVRSEIIGANGGGYKLGVDVTAAVESDLALTVAVLRRANSGSSRSGRIATVPAALAELGAEGVREVVENAPSFDLFEHSGSWGMAPQLHRIHAVATQRAAARVARAIAYQGTDELLVAALLHDIGKLVLTLATPGYLNLPGAGVDTPEQRIKRERRETGVDHALVGGVLARRWRFPRGLARAIERHHEPSEAGLAGMVRLADMIARFEAGNPVSSDAMRAAANGVGLDDAGLSALITERTDGERRSAIPSPLTPGEQRVLRELAKGHLYKQIAATLELSVSTVRSHLYNTYRKLGVSDRAQTILLAKENRWI